MLSTQSMPIVQGHLGQSAKLSQAIIDPEYPLHYCTFFGLRDQLNQALISIDPEQLNKQDCYGNTALHIAIMLGHRECAEALLAAKCAVSIRNKEGWNPLSEAISYGSHSLTKKLYKILRGQMFDREKVHHYGQVLQAIPDCQLDFEWEIVTRMPFLSKVLPSDVCCMRKIGNCLRLDTSLIDISAFSSTRGDISVVFNPSTHPPMLILNHKKKTFQSIGAKHMHLEHDVEILRSTELLHMRLCLDKMVCNRNGARHARWSPSVGKVMNYSSTSTKDVPEIANKYNSSTFIVATNRVTCIRPLTAESSQQQRFLMKAYASDFLILLRITAQNREIMELGHSLPETFKPVVQTHTSIRKEKLTSFSRKQDSNDRRSDHNFKSDETTTSTHCAL